MYLLLTSVLLHLAIPIQSAENDKETPETVVMHHNSSKPPEDGCFCEYLVADDNIFAHANFKRLVFGDKVPKGSTMYFRCLSDHRRIYERLQTKICDDCKPWSSSIISSCTPPTTDKEKPETVVTQHNSSKPAEENCFCEYLVADDNIFAHANFKRLVRGDKVPKGSTMYFRCLNDHRRIYERLQAKMCDDCKPWNSSIFSSCTSSTRDKEKGETVVMLPDSTKPPEDECFCEYLVTNDNIFAHANFKRLVLGDKVRKGSTMYFRCVHDHLRPYGRIQQIICNDCKPWNSSIFPSCTPSTRGPELLCPEFPEDNTIAIKYEMGRRENSKASFSCPKEGQELIGKAELTCLRSGQWSDPAPRCSSTDLLCPEFPEDNSILIEYKMGRRENSKVSFSCPKEGQELIGQAELICLRSGQWSDAAPRCSSIAGCVLNLGPSSDLEVEPVKEIYSLGDDVLLWCPRGKKLSKAVERLMCLSDSWSDTVPSCIEEK